MTIIVPRSPRSRRRITPGDVARFYDGRGSSKPKPPVTLNPETWTLTNTPNGLGDSVVITDLPRAAAEAGKTGMSWLTTDTFRTLTEFNLYHVDRQTPWWVSASAAQSSFDLGPGHIIQKIQRLFGLPVSPWPHGSMFIDFLPPAKKKVSLHFDPGGHVEHQRRLYHPRAREVYPENLKIIRDFMAANEATYDFIEVGGRQVIGGCQHVSDLRSMIAAMCDCSVHLGIISGPYHLANALGVQTIPIINFPAPWDLMLPVVKNIDVVEVEWLYPQSYVLHQDHDSEHMPAFCRENLEKAFAKKTYPYEDPTEYLNMVKE